MTLRELLNQVEKTPENECWVNLNKIAQEVGLYGDFDDEQTELTCYFTKSKWFCTDTMVGIRAYYLNNELVAISSQIGRKYEQEFEWVSRETFDKVREFIYARLKKEEPAYCVIADMEYDVSSWVR